MNVCNPLPGLKTYLSSFVYCAVILRHVLPHQKDLRLTISVCSVLLVLQPNECLHHVQCQFCQPCSNDGHSPFVKGQTQLLQTSMQLICPACYAYCRPRHDASVSCCSLHQLQNRRSGSHTLLPLGPTEGCLEHTAPLCPLVHMQTQTQIS